MAPSSDVNDTDEDESNNSIVHERFHKPSSENLSMDVSESECNIVNKISSQFDSSDVPTYGVTEFNYDDHIEPSANVKEASYFNIFECGSDLLDQLDVTHQRAFTESEKHHEYQQDIMNYLQHKRDTMIYVRNGGQKSV